MLLTQLCTIAAYEVGEGIGSDSHTGLSCYSSCALQVLGPQEGEAPKMDHFVTPHKNQQQSYPEDHRSAKGLILKSVGNSARPCRLEPCSLQAGEGPGVLVLWEVVTHLYIKVPCRSSMGHAH